MKVQRLAVVLLLGAIRAIQAVESCTPDRPVMAHREGASVYWTNCTEDKGLKQSFSYPAGVKAFPYVEKIFKQIDPAYPSDLTKVDLLWMDQVININTPLRSFGGDVILIADTININAPVDSRVYIESGIDHFAPGDMRARTHKVSVDANPRYTYAPALLEYYNKCIMCDYVDTRKTQLPDGIGAASPDIADGAGMKFDGSDAPGKDRLDYSKLRSGNVYVYARSIHISDPLLNPTNLSSRADCDASNTVQRVPFAINASGLDGGRGGTGSLHCASRYRLTAEEKENKFVRECTEDERTTAGGVSGKGSDGADGGDITVLILKSGDQSTLVQMKEIISRVTKTSGGTPTRERFQTPPVDGPGAVTSSRCSFPTVSSDSQIQPGIDGRKYIADASSLEILNSVISVLASKDLRSDYDYNSLLTVAKIDESIYSLAPSSVFSDYLLDSLLKAEDRHAEDVRAVFADNKRDTGNYLPWLFTNFTSRDLTKINDVRQNQELLEALMEYQGSDGVMSPFRATGGLFKLHEDIYARMAAGQLRVNINLEREALTSIANDLREINTEVLVSAQQSRADGLRVRLIALQTAIGDAQSEAQKLSTVPGVLEQLSNLKDLAAAVGGIVGGISSGQYEAAAGLIQPASNSFAKLMAPIPPYSGEKVRDLQKQLVRLEQVFREFSAFMAESKEEFMNLKYQSLMDQLRTRESLQALLNGQAILGPQIVKIVLVSYFNDLQRNSVELRRNLSEIHKYLKGFPYKDAVISLSSINRTCLANSQCMIVEASEKPRLIWYDQVVAGQSRKLPLYLLGPLNQQEPLPIFRLSREHIHITSLN